MRILKLMLKIKSFATSLQIQAAFVIYELILVLKYIVKSIIIMQ